MSRLDFEEEEFQFRPKMKDNRPRFKQNFKNVDPKDILSDDWEEQDDEYYEPFERFRR